MLVMLTFRFQGFKLGGGIASESDQHSLALDVFRSDEYTSVGLVYPIIIRPHGAPMQAPNERGFALLSR